eukprot:2158617-Pleurochrysis_carterae.AAC.1
MSLLLRDENNAFAVAHANLPPSFCKRYQHAQSLNSSCHKHMLLFSPASSHGGCWKQPGVPWFAPCLVIHCAPSYTYYIPSIRTTWTDSTIDTQTLWRPTPGAPRLRDAVVAAAAALQLPVSSNYTIASYFQQRRGLAHGSDRELARRRARGPSDPDT